MNYDKAYFLQKFTAIPEEQWIEGKFTDELGRHCALGFCDMATREDVDLCELFDWHVSKINDGNHTGYQQPTPRQRILAALHDLP